MTMDYTEIKSIRTSVSYWYIILLIGLIYLAVGFMVLVRPVEALIALATLLGFGFILAGIIEIVFSLANRREMHNWGWPFVLGILTLLVGLAVLGIFFSFALLMSHMLSGGMIIIWTGLSFISAGVYNLVLSLRLRKLKGISSRLSEELVAKYREIQSEIQRELSKH